MALEGFAALGVASSIVQLVDFGTKLFSKSRELYCSTNGLLDENYELEIIAGNLQRLSKGLVRPNSGAAYRPQIDSDLDSLARACKNIADELLEATEQLRIKGAHRKRKAFAVALKTVWQPGKIDDLKRRLDLASSQMILCLINVMNSDLSSLNNKVGALSREIGQIQSKDASNFTVLRSQITTILQTMRTQQASTHDMMSQGVDREQESASRIQDLYTKLDGMLNAGTQVTTQSRIVESLLYKRMETRGDKISAAHAKTFEWIVDRDSRPIDMQPEDSFVDWLADGRGIFWISGKAGSGKSTLMKHLGNHPQAMHALRKWAGTQPLVTASFYFWFAGTEIQKSQVGLLRSLLFNIFRQCPDLLPMVVPARWEQCSRQGFSPEKWSRAELKDAIERLRNLEEMPCKICFFIDGLDEYDGDHQDIIDLLRQFTHSDNIKVCTSSRPWNPFELAFGKGQCPKLRLEDLTRNDIKRFVQDQLEGNALFRQLMAAEPVRCERLLLDIVYKAQGVFLWVYLVTRSIVRGLLNADTITDLERRVAQLPDELTSYFEHILGSIEKIYEQQTAWIFETALQAPEPLSLLTYVMMDEYNEDPDFALKMKVRNMSLPEIDARHEKMKLRINARCLDLLQVSKIKRTLPPLVWVNKVTNTEDVEYGEICTSTKSNTTARGHDRWNASYPQAFNFFPEFEVDFLHRTVRDFLRQREMSDWVQQRLPDGFKCSEALCHANLAQIKCLPFRVDQLVETSTLSCLLKDIFINSGQLEDQTGKASVMLLDELSSVMEQHNSGLTDSVCHSMKGRRDPLLDQIRRSFLSAAKEYNLKRYLAERSCDDQTELRRGALRKEYKVPKVHGPQAHGAKTMPYRQQKPPFYTDVRGRRVEESKSRHQKFVREKRYLEAKGHESDPITNPTRFLYDIKDDTSKLSATLDSQRNFAPRKSPLATELPNIENPD